MNTIRSINDLLWARENQPKLIEWSLSQVTVQDDLERYLLWLYEDEARVSVTSILSRFRMRSAGIHPSSACKKGVCLLKLYYECTQEIEPQRPYNQKDYLTWDVGTLLHDLYQAHFREMYGDQFQDEVKLVDESIHVKSRTDGIFDFDKVKFVLEMKSIKEGGNFGWEKVQAKPMEDNVRQAHFYMALSDSPFALIFYINKNAGLFKEHAVQFDPTLWQEILEEVVDPVTGAAFREGKMVPASPGYGCRWCDFNHRCPAANKEKAHVKGSRKPWGRG